MDADTTEQAADNTGLTPDLARPGQDMEGADAGRKDARPSPRAGMSLLANSASLSKRRRETGLAWPLAAYGLAFPPLPWPAPLCPALPCPALPSFEDPELFREQGEGGGSENLPE